MKKRLLKITAILLSVFMLLPLFSGCSNKDKNLSLKEEQKLVYWVELNSNAAMTVSDYGETPFAKELQKRLGIKIEYQHPPQGKAGEKFNLLLAMDELPDIVEYGWAAYPGGPSKAISDGIIKDLSKNEDKIPNLSTYLKNNKDVEKLIKTDKGEIFGFPFIRGEKSLQVSAGIVIRQDWLDDLGLAIPKTISEWEIVLKAFRDKKGATAPLTMTMSQLGWGAFVGAFGTTQGTYIDNGIVKLGSMQPEYKEFLKTFNSWYKEKLLDNNIASLDSKTIDANILNGMSGVALGSIGSGIGRWTTSAKQPGYSLSPAPYPTLVNGTIPEFGQIQLPTPGGFSAITKGCKNLDAAYKLLDYGYGNEGHMLFNFGVEGESYKMVDGYPKYTDVITKNPDGLSMTAAMARYIQAYINGPFVQDKRYMDQYASLPKQQEAWKVWSNTNADKHIMPLIYLDEQKAGEIAKITAAVNTYESEMLIKFVMGIEPLENYDKFIEGMKSRGAEKILAAQQEAYDRFLKR